MLKAAPLDLTAGLRTAASEVCALVPNLAHVELGAVHFAVFRSRAAERTLTYARCYGLPWEERRRGRRRYALSPLHTEAGARARYLLAFAWPRFWTLPPRTRLETLLHELYHVGPDFDGRARTFGKGGPHGRGRRWYDDVVHDLAEAHLPPGLELEHPVLALPLDALTRVTGERLRPPRWEAVGQGS